MFVALIGVGFIDRSLPASTDKPTARDDGAPPSTPVAEASHETTLQDDPTSRPLNTMTAADGTLYSCEEISAILDKMDNGVESKEKMPGTEAGKTTKTTSYGKAIDNIITSHKFRKSQKAMSHVNLADIGAATISCGTSTGDTGVDKGQSEEKVEIMAE